MHIFEKLPQIFPIVKFRSTLEKSDPSKHLADPLQPKNFEFITGRRPNKEGHFSNLESFKNMYFSKYLERKYLHKS